MFSKGKFHAPEDCHFQLMFILLNGWGSTNSRPQAMRSIPRVQQGRIPCARTLPDPHFPWTLPALGTESLKYLKEHANLEGHVQKLTDVQTFERLGKPELQTTRRVSSRHAVCPHDTPCVLTTFVQVTGFFKNPYKSSRYGRIRF